MPSNATTGRIVVEPIGVRVHRSAASLSGKTRENDGGSQYCDEIITSVSAHTTECEGEARFVS